MRRLMFASGFGVSFGSSLFEVYSRCLSKLKMNVEQKKSKKKRIDQYN